MVIRYCSVLQIRHPTIRTPPETCLLGIGLHQYHYAPTCLGLFVDRLYGFNVSMPTSNHYDYITSTVLTFQPISRFSLKMKRTALMRASLPLKNLWLFVRYNPPLWHRLRNTYRTVLGTSSLWELSTSLCSSHFAATLNDF